MPLVEGIENVHYTGADIVELAVENNQKRFETGGSESGGEDPELGDAIAAFQEMGKGLQDPVFVQADMVEGLPTSQDGAPYDLVFVR